MFEDFFDVCNSEDEESINIQKVSVETIIPQKGSYLGLDVSKESTGICFIQDGEKVTGNVFLGEDVYKIRKSENWAYEEVLLRRSLKTYLRELVSGVNFDVIVIEDVFSGENPKTTRLLYSLNTAIDELILEKVCSCKKFLRIPNGVWKSWLGKGVDPMNKNKGLNDKVKVQNWLKSIGVEEGYDQGFQDRLDATGMILGYFLQKDVIDREYRNSGIKVTWSMLDMAYELDTSFIFDEKEWLSDLEVLYVDINKASKKEILKLINDNPESLIISSKPIYLGLTFKKFGFDIIDGGGYLAFWVKKSARKKVFGKES